MKAWILAVALGLSAMGSAALAQNPFAPARIVNQSIISNYEVSQRQRMMTVLGATDPGRTEVVNILTDDRLKTQAAEELGLLMTDEARQEGLEAFAARRQMSPGALQARLQRNGISTETLEAFLASEVLWRGVVNARFRDRASPSEADVENALNAAANRAQESVFLREIAIPFAERGQQGARNLAARIQRDVANGASFAAFARQYSRTPSGPNGGALGWRPVNRMPPQLANQLLALLPGEVAEPIEVPAGIILIQLADIREEPTNNRRDVSATYVQLVLPPEAGMSAANETAASLHSCSEAAIAAKAAGAPSGQVGPIPLDEIPTDIGLVLSGLDTDEVGITAPGEAGISVIYLCARAVVVDPEQVESLRASLFNRRMQSFAAGYLSELRADAVITDK